MNKIEAFEYIVNKLGEWYKEETGIENINDNDLGMLKVMKMIFFISGVKQENHLFDLFNGFMAWSRGHIEFSLYFRYFEKKPFSNFTINSKNTTFSDKNDVISDFSSMIDKNINALKQINSSLIKYSEYELMNLCKSYHSWKMYYKTLNKQEIVIDKDILIYEPKYYK